MCGILGYVSQTRPVDLAALRSIATRLLLVSETRGKEAAGIAFSFPERLDVHREAVSASHMARGQVFQKLLTDVWARLESTTAPQSVAFIGHARLVTNGLQVIDANNQPVVVGSVVLVHNGIVVNERELWEEIPDHAPTAEVDTEVIGALLEHHLNATGSIVEATRETFKAVRGEASILALFTNLNVMLLATNTGSLFLGHDDASRAKFIVSEARMARQLIGASGLPGFASGGFTQLAPNVAMLIDLDTLEQTPFELTSRTSVAYVAPQLGVQRRVEGQWKRDDEARRRMRRCTRCLLPETMPFIDFDSAGVCSYCRNYRPIVLEGRAALEAKLAPHRRTDGGPDCVVAFSGGRDSSYGLHLLKREFGMNPVAYTYDWGMVTDIARRDQARMCGTLGIEHIWISADIKTKRDNIRRNVNAWMKRAELGMIPLFMAGDKLFFKYANQVMADNDLRLMVFCTNKMEKTDFKTGFCGIAPDHGQQQPFRVSWLRQMQMLAYYGKNFLLNPAYLNRSLVDSLAAFVSLYHQERDYLYLYDYYPWVESEVDDVLRSKYDWETAPDLKSTWRIGDGSAAFYNYVYYSVAGFSEHDTFRSNQIREGHIDRATAWCRVQEENQPRWEALRDYTRIIGVDFDDLVKAVNNMPKLYRGLA